MVSANFVFRVLQIDGVFINEFKSMAPSSASPSRWRVGVQVGNHPSVQVGNHPSDKSAKTRVFKSTIIQVFKLISVRVFELVHSTKRADCQVKSSRKIIQVIKFLKSTDQPTSTYHMTTRSNSTEAVVDLVVRQLQSTQHQRLNLQEAYHVGNYASQVNNSIFKKSITVGATSVKPNKFLE